MTPREVAPRQARDVMAFGQETGRVLSDGRIIGRSEPFAKVFQSSRLVKQAVGLTAWGILEDIALDAILDAEGRLVAETSARRIADNLGINKETVTRHLARLRDYGFVLHEEVRHRGSGRYDTARYVLDPSACLERFTTTPPRRQGARSAPCTENPVTVKPVSGKAGHGRTGHGESVHQEQAVAVPQEQQQQKAPPAELIQLGVDEATASTLAAAHSPARIHEVAQAAAKRARQNPAGWAIRALQGGWDVAGTARAQPASRPTAKHHDLPAPAAVDPDVEQRWQAWDRAVSAALDDDQLARAVALVDTALPAGGRVGPAVRAALIRWAVQAFDHPGSHDLREALAVALEEGRAPLGVELQELPPCPSNDAAVPPLRERLRHVLSPSRTRGAGL
jgi:predicted transcriptional regulator